MASIKTNHAGAANGADTCQAKQVHPERVAGVVQQMLPSHSLHHVAELFKVLGDPTRVRILHALSHSELCVCDLCEALSMSPSAVSHQLRLLRSAKLVRFRREGKNVHYKLDDDHVETLLQQALEHIQEARSHKERAGDEGHGRR